jgi:YbbR domain-containing protein
VTDSVTIGVADPALRLRAQRSATVTVHVIPGPVEQDLANRPIRLRNLESGLTAELTPPAVMLVLRGSRQGIERIALADVQAFVDLTGVGPGDYSLPVRADSPPGAGVARINPATVHVHVVRGNNCETCPNALRH